jgi:NAD(P)-dependent dehydrogenase (short-subunit alcohol dehydrogenase family)
MKKHVVITGSTRGIGLAMAHEFLKAGWSVTLSGRYITYPISDELAKFKPAVEYYQCNVQDLDSVQELWDHVINHWGRCDIWINNAGINTTYHAIWDTQKTTTDAIIATNILGVIYGCQVAVKGMLTQGFGAVYSMEGMGSNNMIQPNTILYGMTKHALTYLMKGLALELQNTKVIAGRLSPGMMLTDFITKTPDGQVSTVIDRPAFKRVFNILADYPEVVAPYLVKNMITNQTNGKHIVWLTNLKVIWRFMTAPLRKRKLI